MKCWFYCLLLLTMASIQVKAAKGGGRGSGRRGRVGSINRFGVHNMPNLNRNSASDNYYENKDVSLY